MGKSYTNLTAYPVMAMPDVVMDLPRLPWIQDLRI
jgi:hypothetical protein